VNQIRVFCSVNFFSFTFSSIPIASWNLFDKLCETSRRRGLIKVGGKQRYTIIVMCFSDEYIVLFNEGELIFYDFIIPVRSVWHLYESK